MKKSELYAALRTEIHLHDFSYVDDPSVARGGRGVVVAGCPTCKKRISNMLQFLGHLTDDVLPAVLDRLSSEAGLSESFLAANNRVFISTKCTFPAAFKVLEPPLYSTAPAEYKTLICNLYNPLRL